VRDDEGPVVVAQCDFGNCGVRPELNGSNWQRQQSERVRSYRRGRKILPQNYFNSDFGQKQDLFFRLVFAKMVAAADTERSSFQSAELSN
jgi:hypothetical protein